MLYVPLHYVIRPLNCIKKVKRSFLLPLLFILTTVFFSNHVYAYNDGDTSVLKKELHVIKTLQACRVPSDLFYHIKNYTPDEIVKMNDEYQHTSDNDNTSMILETKFRFKNDTIVGYQREVYVDNAKTLANYKSIIQIPVVWVCVPGENHTQHTATSIDEIKRITTSESCKAWMQRDTYLVLQMLTKLELAKQRWADIQKELSHFKKKERPQMAKLPAFKQTIKLTLPELCYLYTPFIDLPS
jgi:hypothetical protein